MVQGGSGSAGPHTEGPRESRAVPGYLSLQIACRQTCVKLATCKTGSRRRRGRENRTCSSKHSDAWSQMLELAVGATATHKSRQSSLTARARCVHGRRCKAEAVERSRSGRHPLCSMVMVRMMARWRQRARVWGRGRPR